MAPLPAGLLLVGSIDNLIYRWDGSAWDEGLSLPDEGSVAAVAVDPANGDILVPLLSIDPNGIPSTLIFRYNGTSWDSGIPAPESHIDGMAVDPSNSDILALGRNIYRHDGTSWGTGLAGPSEETGGSGIAVDPANGNILLVGFGTDRVYRYDGTSWDAGLAVPSNVTSPQGITVNPSNGNILIVSRRAGRIYRHDGTSWDSGEPVPASETQPRGLALTFLNPVNFVGQSLAASAALQRATVTADAVPGIALSAQRLAAQAALAAATVRAPTPLTLADWTAPDGAEVLALGLIRAGYTDRGGGTFTFYQLSQNTGTLIDGELTLEDVGFDLTRLDVLSNGSQVRAIQTSDASADINSWTEILADGAAYEDMSLWLQTFEGTVELPSSAVAFAGTDEFARARSEWNVPESGRAALAGILGGDTVIVAVTRPFTMAVSLVGQSLAASAALQRATVTADAVPGIALNGQRLAASATLARATVTADAVPGIALNGQRLAAGATLARATVTADAVPGIALNGQRLAASATLARATVTADAVPGIALNGQRLAASATLARATVTADAVPGIALNGQTLAGRAALARAALTFEAVPGIALNGQTLAGRAALAAATVRAPTPLTLADWTVPDGSEVLALGLIRAGYTDRGGGTFTFYQLSQNTGSLIDGELTLEDVGFDLTRLDVLSNGSQVRAIQTSDAAADINSWTEILADGAAYEDMSLWLQTFEGTVEIPSSAVAFAGTDEFARARSEWNVPESGRAALAGILGGDTVIVAVTRPFTMAVSLVGQSLAASAALQRATVTADAVPGIALNGQRLAASATLARATVAGGTLLPTILQGQRLSGSAVLLRAMLTLGDIAGIALNGLPLAGRAVLRGGILTAPRPGSFREEKQKLVTDRLITLFDIDLRPLGQSEVYHWISAEAEPDPVVWRGNTYIPLPISATGYGVSAQGPSPRPELTISNVALVPGTIVNEFGDPLGAIVTRWVTYARFLDDGTDPRPDDHFPPAIFVVERKTHHDATRVTFELSSRIDQQGRMLPGRQVIRDFCPLIYRVWDPDTGQFDYSNATCPYVGLDNVQGGIESPYFTPDGTQTADPAQDRCGKRLFNCRQRFGRRPLPYGGFPAVLSGAARGR